MTEEKRKPSTPVAKPRATPSTNRALTDERVCTQCDEVILPGTPLALMSDGSWGHQWCAETL